MDAAGRAIVPPLSRPGPAGGFSPRRKSMRAIPGDERDSFRRGGLFCHTSKKTEPTGLAKVAVRSMHHTERPTVPRSHGGWRSDLIENGTGDSPPLLELEYCSAHQLKPPLGRVGDFDNSRRMLWRNLPCPRPKNRANVIDSNRRGRIIPQVIANNRERNCSRYANLAPRAQPAGN